MKKTGYVYIATNSRNGTLYIGVTSDIVRRAYEHRHGAIEGFSSKYNCKRVVYVEVFDDVREAIARGKSLKAWRRSWKIALIEKENSAWRDLWPLISTVQH